MGDSPKERKTLREKIAKTMLVAAALALFSSVFFPYWHLTVRAPQYPKGLRVQIYLNRVTGDIQEIDTLNHYIGMRPLGEAAKIERRFAIPGLAVLLAALLIAVFIRGKWSALFIVPAVLFPAIFAGGLYFWLRDFGLHLNPKAPLSSSVKPFIPPLLGHGKIAQFQAVADFSWGHGLSMLAMILCVAVIALRFFPPKNKI